MERAYIKEIKQNKKVLLKGWILEIRDLSKIKFIILRDYTGAVQCIIKDEKLFNEFSKLSLESVIEITGIVKKAIVKSEEVSNNKLEIEIQDFKLLNKAEKLPILPLEKSITTGLSKRLDYRYLDLRKKEIKAIFKIQSTIINAFREFFYKNDFIEIQPPSIIATSTEGGTDLFEVKYFEKKTYLAQSPQLYKQMAAISLEKVFCTMTVWRAEKHNTIKHLNEIRQMDIEVAFADDFMVMKYLEDVVKYICKKVNEDCKQELEVLKMKIKIPSSKYLSYEETISLLNKNKINIKYGDDFDSDSEKKLCEIFPDTIIFIHSWPKSLKPFYIWSKGNITGGFDAIYGNMEISSGGQRVHIPDILIQQLKEKNLNPKDFEWYVDAFRFGAPQHSGWSIGLERFTMALLKLDNIREATLFPRDRERLTP